MSKVAVARLMHEWSSFNPARTPIGDFDIQQRDLGRWTKGSTEVAGFLAEAAAQGLDIVPLFGASATPSGPVQRDAYEQMVGCILDNLAAAQPVDAVYLALHGAMVA